MIKPTQGIAMKIEKDNIMTIELPSCVDGEYCENLLLSIKEWLLTPIELYSLDFKNTTEFRQSCYRPLLTISQFIRKSGKSVVCFNLNSNIDRQIKLDGISDALNVVDNYDTFLVKMLGVRTAQIDVRLINPFLEATLVTLEKQAKTKSEAQKPQLVSVDEKEVQDDIAIAGIILLSTEQCTSSKERYCRKLWIEGKSIAA
jgi:hypothetical protein